jgi:hypothetical protein
VICDFGFLWNGQFVSISYENPNFKIPNPKNLKNITRDTKKYQWKMVRSLSTV